MKKEYLVQGDHVIFRRIDESFDDINEASKLIGELIEYNYENIKLNGKEITHDIYKDI